MVTLVRIRPPDTSHLPSILASSRESSSGFVADAENVPSGWSRTVASRNPRVRLVTEYHDLKTASLALYRILSACTPCRATDLRPGTSDVTEMLSIRPSCNGAWGSASIPMHSTTERLA